MGTAHDRHLVTRRSDPSRPRHRVLQHRAGAYERAILLRSVAPQPAQDQGPKAFAFSPCEDDRPYAPGLSFTSQPAVSWTNFDLNLFNRCYCHYRLAPPGFETS